MTFETVGIIPLEYDDRPLLDSLAGSLEEVLHAGLPAELHPDCEVGGVHALPEAAWNRRREQYVASEIVEYLSSLRGGYDKVLGITDRDIYEQGMNFVFGVAHIGMKAAVVSLHRLHPEYAAGTGNPGLFFERAVKEAVHETGHLYWLAHCPNPRCVMHYSNALPDTDIKGRIYCPACQEQLRERFL